MGFYNIVYEAIEDVKKALEGLLGPSPKGKIRQGRGKTKHSSVKKSGQ